jgi:hypothetical protein
MSLLTAMPGKQEDITTVALAYIWNTEPITGRVWDEIAGVSCTRSSWSTQVKVIEDENKEGIIDLVYQDLKSVVAVEAKYWAYFTDNQPHVYLKWLKKKYPDLVKTLILLIPQNRIDETRSLVSSRVQKHFHHTLKWVCPAFNVHRFSAENYCGNSTPG